MHGIEMRWPQAAVVLLLAMGRVWADDPPASDAKPAAPQGVDLTVDAAPEPTPALKYHLLPPIQEQKQGNAAPIYLRIAHERSGEWKDRLVKESARLLDMAPSKLPIDETRKHLDSFAGVLDELSAAGRRSDCNWEYVLEDRDPMGILLPDAHQLRAYGRLLALKAKFAAVSGDAPQALGALEDGFALSQHASQAPFFVNRLIATAIGGLMLDQAELLIQQPGAPNLYWALAALPCPFVDMAGAFPVEQDLLILTYPEITHPEGLRPEDWQRIVDRMRALAKGFADPADEPKTQVPVPAEKLAAARDYLRETLQFPAEKVRAMSDAEVIVRYTVALHREMVDDSFKWCYLPTAQALPGAEQRAVERKSEAQRRELFFFVSDLIPGGHILGAQARTERRVARLMAVEALRMHAAATGSLPATLAEVQVVPVPNDPGTGRAFDYRLEGGAAVLDIADLSASDREALRLPVRLKLRAK